MEGLNFSGERNSDILVTIDGKAGAGKGTLADHISSSLGINKYSAGDFFRQIADERGLTVNELSEKADKETDLEIDRRTFRKGLSESCVIESRISCHVLKDYSDLKIRLKADEDERAERVADRESISVDEALQRIRKRDRDNQRRYMDYYSIDMNDLGIYDLVIDNTGLNIEETNSLVDSAIENFLHNKLK